MVSNTYMRKYWQTLSQCRTSFNCTSAVQKHQGYLYLKFHSTDRLWITRQPRTLRLKPQPQRLTPMVPNNHSTLTWQCWDKAALMSCRWSHVAVTKFVIKAEQLWRGPASDLGGHYSSPQTEAAWPKTLSFAWSNGVWLQPSLDQDFISQL